MSQNIKQTISIIGCGYLGKKLLKRLMGNTLAEAQNIHTVVKTTSSQKQCLELGVQSNIVDLDIHQSTLAYTPRVAQLLYYFTPPPAQGTEDRHSQHFIEMLEQHYSSPPQKVVLISTTGVYGNCHGQWVDEETPLNPGVDRARRRVSAEQQWQRYCHKYNIPLVILRVSGIYGRGKLPIQRIQAQTPIVRAEDSPFSNRIHIEDLLEICITAGFSENIKGIFNCSDGNPSTMYDYFIKVAQTFHLPEPPAISLEQAKTQLSPGMLSYMKESRRINNQKLIKQFKLTLKYPELEQGLRAILHDKF